ncbi:hypothetical protein C0581_04470 [Candidatus Parcubacteria bacterium]|nr:MAG: hypothetical protein C0581_04470 [Candidatus Parcubacteria bacterium]
MRDRGHYGHSAQLREDRIIDRVDRNNSPQRGDPDIEEGSAAVNLEVDDLSSSEPVRRTREQWRKMRADQGLSPYAADEQPKPKTFVDSDTGITHIGGGGGSVSSKFGRRRKKKRRHS